MCAPSRMDMRCAPRDHGKEDGSVKRIAFDVKKEFCAECALALRRFIGKMDGVTSIETGEGSIVIDFDEQKIGEDRVRKITTENLEKLGYS